MPLTSQYFPDAMCTHMAAEVQPEAATIRPSGLRSPHPPVFGPRTSPGTNSGSAKSQAKASAGLFDPRKSRLQLQCGLLELGKLFTLGRHHLFGRLRDELRIGELFLDSADLT